MFCYFSSSDNYSKYIYEVGNIEEVLTVWLFQTNDMSYFDFRTVGPHGEAKVTFQFTPKHIGLRTYVVGFDSKEISDISGTFSLNVVQI